MLGPKIMCAVAVAGALCAAGAATAQNSVLSTDEIRAELFGVRLTGVNDGFVGVPWEECIDPTGATRYRFGAVQDQGRLSVDEAGLACFAYLSGSRSCFVVAREGGNYRFGSFVTTRVERGVTSCEGGANISRAPSSAAPAR